WGEQQRSTAMSNKANLTVATMGIDIGENAFHVVGLDRRGAIVLRQRWSRGQVEARVVNMPPCLIGMEACVGAHHLSRKLQSQGHDARLMPAKYVRPYSPAQANWLEAEEREWLATEMEKERKTVETGRAISVLQSLFNPRVLALAAIHFGQAGVSVGIAGFAAQSL